MFAADGTWTNVAGGTWSTPTNWSGTVADGDDAVANFNTLDITSDVTVTLDSPRTVGGLSFGDTTTTSAAGWTLSSSTLTLSTTAGTPTITVNALGSISGAPKTVVINSTLAGSQGLTKAGSGVLVLNANNTFTGTVNVNAGTLKLGNGSNAGTVSGDIAVASGAILQFDRVVTGGYTVANNISGAGSVTKSNGSGQLTLSGTNTYTGGTSITSGALFVAGNNSLGSGTLTMSQATRFGSSDNTTRTIANLVNISAVGNGQNVTFGAGSGATSGLGDLVFTSTGSSAAPSGSGTITIHNATTVTFNQAFTGGGRINKLGTGVLVLAGTNTYSGGTTVSAGSLLVNGVLSGAGAITVNSAGTFGGSGTIASASTANAGSFLAAGAASGAAGILTFSSTLDVSGLASGTGGLLFDLGAIGSSDKIVSGSLTIGTGVLDLNDFSFTTLSGFGAGTYTLLDATSVVGTLGSSLNGTIGGLDAVLSISGNDLVLTVSAIPEPASFAMLTGGALLGLAVWRRRGIRR